MFGDGRDLVNDETGRGHSGQCARVKRSIVRRANINLSQDKHWHKSVDVSMRLATFRCLTFIFSNSSQLLYANVSLSFSECKHTPSIEVIDRVSRHCEDTCRRSVISRHAVSSCLHYISSKYLLNLFLSTRTFP